MRTWYLTDKDDATNTRAYNDIHDLLSDVFYSDDPRVLDLIKEWVSELYAPIEVPGDRQSRYGRSNVEYL